jgi:CoA:oxalate CoA-transferase
VEQAVSSAQTAFRQLLVNGEHPVAGPIRMMEQPVHYSGVKRGKLERSPLLGEHTDAVLCDWLDADGGRIETLKRNKVIA